MKRLAPLGMPSLAVGEGATSPNPGYQAVAWSTTLNAVVHWNGSAWTVQQQITVSATAPSTPYVGQLWLDIS